MATVRIVCTPTGAHLEVTRNADGPRRAASREPLSKRCAEIVTCTTVRTHVSAAGGKRGFINELLAARGTTSIVSAMSEAGLSPLTSRRAKQRTGRPPTP